MKTITLAALILAAQQPYGSHVGDMRSWGASITFKSFSHGRSGAGAHYIAGFYDAPAADANLNQGSATVTYGDAGDDEPWGAHAFLVAADAGTTDAGTVSIVVSGTSITDAGVRTASDSETIVSDVTAMTTDAYYETAKKWLGQVTYTLTGAGGATTFAADFNYGFAKYDDYGNRDFTITDFECTGAAGASNTLDIELLHHKATGWTYHATAFTPGAAAVLKMTTDYAGPENGVTINKPFAYKRAGLSQLIDGSDSEGVIIRFTAGAATVIEHMDCHVGISI